MDSLDKLLLTKEVRSELGRSAIALINAQFKCVNVKYGLDYIDGLINMAHFLEVISDNEFDQFVKRLDSLRGED